MHESIIKEQGGRKDNYVVKIIVQLLIVHVFMRISICEIVIQVSTFSKHMNFKQ